MTRAATDEKVVIVDDVLPDLSHVIADMFKDAETALKEAVEFREEQQKHELAQFNCII